MWKRPAPSPSLSRRDGSDLVATPARAGNMGWHSSRFCPFRGRSAATHGASAAAASRYCSLAAWWDRVSCYRVPNTCAYNDCIYNYVTNQPRRHQWTSQQAKHPGDRERDAVVGRMMAGGGRPGLADPGLLSGKTGLGLLQAMLRGELPFPPIAETLD